MSCKASNSKTSDLKKLLSVPQESKFMKNSLNLLTVNCPLCYLNLNLPEKDKLLNMLEEKSDNSMTEILSILPSVSKQETGLVPTSMLLNLLKPYSDIAPIPIAELITTLSMPITMLIA